MKRLTQSIVVITAILTIFSCGGGGSGGGGTTPPPGGGTSPPTGAPSDLVITQTSSTSCTMNWSYSGTGEDGFEIYQGATSTNIAILAGTVGQGIMNYQVTGLSPSTTYYFQVRAHNSAGNSAPSNTASTTTGSGPPTIPTAPSNLSATTVSNTLVNLSWTNNSTNEDGIRIYRGTTSTNISSLVGTVPAGTVTFSNDGLAGSTTYYYVVRAYNSVGESASSNITSATTLPNPTLQTIGVTSDKNAVEWGINPQFIATGSYSDASTKNLTASVLWSSTNPAVATVDAIGIVTTRGIGDTTIQAASGTVTGSKTLTVTSPGHFLMKNVGLVTQFDRRGWPDQYWPGQVIYTWDQFDTVVGSTISQEVSLQLDKIKAMGVNTITFELRAADNTDTGIFTPPDCNIGTGQGLQFPQPTATELANLPRFFDMVQSKGMKVWLRLINTHMEEQPPTNSQTWLGAILGVIGNHPALDLVTFEGNTHWIENGTQCGVPAEPPLYLGPGSIPAQYVQWAIGFAMSQGIPARRLSTEAIVGDIFVDSMPPAGPTATDNHLWPTIPVLKMIFDNLNIPASERTYALSLYEHRKCSLAQWLPCTDMNPHDWADQTLQNVVSVVGSGPRIVMSEMGVMNPPDQVNWNTQRALESLVFLMQKHAIDGGTFWRWISPIDEDDSDPTQSDPVKRRGVAFIYNPVQKEVVDMCGFHIPEVPNGSFEDTTVNGVPVNWIKAGNGTVSQYLLTQEPGQPEVPSRGTHAMRIITGSGPNDNVTATSTMIPVTAATTYTTTANMRFAWTGDPNPGGSSASRPQVFINILYFQQNGTPSGVRTKDSFSFFQENSATGFATFPQQYTTPSDATFVEVQFGAMRNGLPTQIILDVDNVR